MKRILITGLDSYVGNHLKRWLEKFPGKYSTDTISLRNEGWKETPFFDYDVVFHVAGIAHVSADPDMESLYYRVNRDLTIEAAKKAKEEGVSQFIFVSSIIVYGDVEDGIIHENTIPRPSNFYGLSKLQAEEGIKTLETDTFKVAILRPPMIYGPGSKGNYPKLAKISRVIPLFPNIKNQRSVLFIDNLSEFIRLLIENEERGSFFPQNAEYVGTSELVQVIAEAHGKQVSLVKFLNPFLHTFGRKLGIMKKVFGNLVYDQRLSTYKQEYRIVNFRESIIATEQKR